MTARTHRILTIVALVLTQVASLTAAVVTLLAGAGAIPALWAGIVPQIVGDVCTVAITVIRMIDDPATPLMPPQATTYSGSQSP